MNLGNRLAYGTSRPCSYYDRGIKVQTRVGQNSLMFELLPVHGSFSMPTITLNILAYSNTSSVHTHLTTFNTIPFMTTIISSYFLFFKLLLSYVLLLYIPHICSDRILTCRIKSIRSPAKVGLVVTDLITSPVVSWEGWETPPPQHRGSAVILCSTTGVVRPLCSCGDLLLSSARHCLRLVDV